MNEGEIEEYAYNEIFPSEAVKPTFSVRKILSLIVLTLLVAIIILFIIAAITNIKALNVSTNPRALVLPFAFVGIYALLSIKKKERSDTKNELEKIIDAIPDETIPLKTILDKYKPNHNNDEYTEKEIIARIIDLLWEGRIQTHKYIIDQKCLVRIKNAPVTESV